MDLDSFGERQQQICAEIQDYLPICSHLNMLCSLRDHLIESLENVEKLIEEVDRETFKEHIKECRVWYNKELKLDIAIDNINWEKECIDWYSCNNRLHSGWSDFDKFMNDCYPLWGVQ